MFAYTECSSENHPDITSAGDHDVHVTLSQPPTSEKKEACYIFVNVSKLPNNFISEMELVSGSRTIEVYTSNGDEYIATCQGSHQERLTEYVVC